MCNSLVALRRLGLLALVGFMITAIGCVELPFNVETQPEAPTEEPPVEEPPAEEPPAEEPPAEEPPAEEPPAEEPPSEPAFAFFIPGEGATVVAPTELSVTGDGITAVRFEIDDQVIFNDESAPFAWTLNPQSHGNGNHSLTVVATHAGGAVVRSRTLTFADTPSGTDQPPEVFAALANLKPGHWYEVPNTKMEAVFPEVLPKGNWSNPAQIINAWNGGAFDTKRDRLIVWGGGHADYAGNEVYAFDLKTLKWLRLNDPSSFGGDLHNEANIKTHADGAPVSRHTYGALQYLPTVDRFYVGSAGALWRLAHGDRGTYLFDLDTLKWSKPAESPVGGIGSTSAVAPDGRVWQVSKYGNDIAVFDPVAHTWTSYRYGTWLGWAHSAEIDPVHNKFVLVGDGKMLMWNLDNPAAKPESGGTTGPRNAESAPAPGLAYHPGRKKIVAWFGGASVYTLDVATKTWTEVATSGSVSPGPQNRNSTFGRFRYCPRHDVFIIVNKTSTNVFVYRLP